MMKPRVRVFAQMSSSSVKAEPEYHGAGQTRRLAGYGTSGNGPNAALKGSLSTLRNRSRHAFRNSPLVKKGNRSNTTTAIGTGIIPRFISEDKAYNELMRKTFDEFSNQCDPEGVLNIYGIQALIDLTRRISGECFVRRRRRSLNSGLTVPLQIQVLEPDFVPITFNEKRANGNKIKFGIEFNSRGQRVAYWMHKNHPGEQDVDSLTLDMLIRVPASDVIHCYKPERPGQVRGEPEAAAAIPKVKTYESYDDAELQRKETRSGYTGMLIRQDFDDADYNFNPFDGKPLYDDVEGGDSASIRPGTFITGLPGEDLKLFDGDNTGSGYKDFTREQKLMIASAINCPFELMTGDWSGVNDRIYRAFIQEYRRGIQMDQDHLIIFQVLRNIGNWFIKAAILAGVVNPKNYLTKMADYHRIEWRIHAWKHIHPVQDIQAAVMAKDNNLNSGDALVAESGYDAEEIDLQNVLAEVRRKELREKHGLSSVKDEADKESISNNEEEKEDGDDQDEEDNKNIINFNGSDIGDFAEHLKEYIEQSDLAVK